MIPLFGLNTWTIGVQFCSFSTGGMFYYPSTALGPDTNSYISDIAAVRHAGSCKKGARRRWRKMAEVKRCSSTVTSLHKMTEKRRNWQSREGTDEDVGSVLYLSQKVKVSSFFELRRQLNVTPLCRFNPSTHLHEDRIWNCRRLAACGTHNF